MIKTRFAPSPTGLLHIGGARTALFCWLYSQKMSGRFVLRVEDTDAERSTEASVKAIFDGMHWLGLCHDEGPFFQTQRLDCYRAAILQLLDQGDAYYCACSKKRLESLREQQLENQDKPRYDGFCRNLDLKPGDASELVIRFKSPQEGSVSFVDHVKGRITVQNRELDDLIIQRTDGSPTYNLSVVVDDRDMAITHVVRGDDHVNNTPRQINILKALGSKCPEYAHLPMILGADGKRLSKRHGAMSVMQYCEDGYLPEALINYLVRLGWSHGDQEIFSVEEMIQHFSLDDINRSAATFDLGKLNWMNQQYLMYSPLSRISELVQQRLKQLQITYQPGADLDGIVDLYRQRVVTVNELVEKILYCFQDFDQYDVKAEKKVLRLEALEPLQLLLHRFEVLEDWQAGSIHQAIETVILDLGLDMRQVAQPLRVVTTGGSFSPPIDRTVAMIGKARTLVRIHRGIDHIKVNKQ